MTDIHPPTKALEDYVIGALGAKDAHALETHIASCAACAAALAHEARLEVALHEIARAPTPMRARARRSRTGVAIGGALAVLASVAAVTLMLRPAERPRSELAEPTARAHQLPAPSLETTSRTAASVDCTDADDFHQCVRAAHRRGLAVTSPVINVPRYEYTAAEQLR